MKDFEKIREIKRTAQGRLLALPGVHTVAVGPKIVGGQRTSEISIMVYLVKKKPLSELRPEEVIPPEIDGVKTDVIESDVFRLCAEDTRTQRPLVGGCRIAPGGFTPDVVMGNPAATVVGGGLGEFGTLGCLARTGGANPKIVAITCHHIVGFNPRGQKKTLTLDGTLTFGGTNTPGTVVAMRLNVGGSDRHVFYQTVDLDTLDSIADAVASRINDLALPGLSASKSGSQVLIAGLHRPPDSLTRNTFSAHAKNTWADIVTVARGKVISVIRGRASQACAAYVNVNSGGVEPTRGVFVRIEKGDNFKAVAKKIKKVINDAKISGVTAEGDGIDITLKGTQEIECEVSDNLQVGQPSNTITVATFLDDRIGVILDAHGDVDVAMIELDSRLKYSADILDMDPTGSSPGAVKGTHDASVEDLALPLRLKKRGFASGLTRGTLQSLHATPQYAVASDQGDPERQVLQRFLTGENAFVIEGVDFAVGGDSGSAVLNADNEVVGILFAASHTHALATPIDAIFKSFKDLNLTIETAAQPGIVKVVP